MTLPYETTPDHGADYLRVHEVDGGAEVELVHRERGESPLGDLTRGNAICRPTDALPLARAILDAAGVEADVVERVPDDPRDLRTLGVDSSAAGSGIPNNPAHPATAAGWRRLAALALARARAIEAEPDPAVVEALAADLAGRTFPDRAGDLALARRLAAAGWEKRKGG